MFFDTGKYSKTAYGTVGDGKCNGVLNVPAYQYDLGDCCKPLKDAICEFEDDCFCHMFTNFHGRILNSKKFFKLADRMRSMGTNGASKNPDSPTFFFF